MGTGDGTRRIVILGFLCEAACLRPHSRKYIHAHTNGQDQCSVVASFISLLPELIPTGQLDVQLMGNLGHAMQLGPLRTSSRSEVSSAILKVRIAHPGHSCVIEIVTVHEN
jgi:hypothetical protein